MYQSTDDVYQSQMATIRTRKKADGSTSYLVQIRINRDKVTVYQESQTFARKQAAVAWAKRRETELAEPGAIERATRVGHTVKQMIDHYLGEKGDSDNFVKQSQNRLGSSLILTNGTGLVSE